jgi:hypothetical protein
MAAPAAKEVESAAAAERHAQSIAGTRAAVAFSRRRDLNIGEFQSAVIPAQFDVDLNVLSE